MPHPTSTATPRPGVYDASGKASPICPCTPIMCWWRSMRTRASSSRPAVLCSPWVENQARSNLRRDLGQLS